MSLASVGQLPPHNLFGQHGPRCPCCSGLGSNLSLPGASGRVTRYASRDPHCRGTGIDPRWEQHLLIERIAHLERQLGVDPRARPHWQPLGWPLDLKNSRQYWEELIAWSTADATAVANTTTEAIAYPDVTIPANYMQDGRRLRITASGKLSTTATPTMVWAIRWGGVAGTLLATTELITMGSGVTNVNWRMEAELQTRTNGATGTILASGLLSVHTAAGTVLQNVFGVSGFDAPAAVTVDLTTDKALSITADWSAASASNTLTGMDYGLESLN